LHNFKELYRASGISTFIYLRFSTTLDVQTKQEQLDKTKAEGSHHTIRHWNREIRKTIFKNVGRESTAWR